MWRVQSCWVLAQEYTDKVSGKTDKRPAFQRMFLDASQKRFDMVAFWSLDRFSREGVLETLQHLLRLTSQGVEWWSYREEYLRSVGVFRHAVLAILAAIAKQEAHQALGARPGRSAACQSTRPRCWAVQMPPCVLILSAVVRLKERVLSVREIAGETGVSAMTVQRILASRA